MLVPGQSIHSQERLGLGLSDKCSPAGIILVVMQIEDMKEIEVLNFKIISISITNSLIFSCIQCELFNKVIFIK